MDQPGKILELKTVPGERANADQTHVDESRKLMEEQWILTHIPLVKHLVQKVMGNIGRATDREDLISAGTLGLVKAAQSFDPSRDVPAPTTPRSVHKPLTRTEFNESRVRYRRAAVRNARALAG